MRALVYGTALLLVATPASGAEQDAKDKVLSGMSVVGDHESPKSLVIVPWKSSDPAGLLAVARMLDEGRGPVDRDVFMRELDYYRLRQESQEGSGAR